MTEKTFFYKVTVKGSYRGGSPEFEVITYGTFDADPLRALDEVKVHLAEKPLGMTINHLAIERVQ